MSDVMAKSFSFALDYLKRKSQFDEDAITVQSFVNEISKNVRSSKHEGQILSRFLLQLKEGMPLISHSRQRQSLVTLIFCCQLSFSSLTKTQLQDLGPIVITFIERSKTAGDKRLGYLALSSLVENCDSEIVYLAVNTIIKDVASKYPVVIATALGAMAHIATIDIVPVLLPIVEKRLSHSDGNVRAKSVAVLRQLYKVAPEFVQNCQRHLKQGISDKDPEVMAAVLPYLHSFLKANPAHREEFATKLVHVLKQVVKNRLPMYMSRQGVPAPWVQINILKILSLCWESLTDKDAIGAVLIEIINRAQGLKNLMSYAVLAECTYLVSKVFDPKHQIFQAVLSCMGSFLHSKQPNLVLIGLQLLSELTTVDSGCCVQFQGIIMNSLSHPDITVKKQTLTLVRSLTNSTNYKVICDHMTAQLKETSTDKYFTTNFSRQIAMTAGKFSTENSWLLTMLHSVLTSGGENVCPETCEKIQVCLAQANRECIENEVKLCFNLLEGSLSVVHLILVVWVMGEYGHFVESTSPQTIIDSICKCCVTTFQENKHFEDKELILLCVITCAMKILARSPELEPGSLDQLKALISCHPSITVNQKLKELEMLQERGILTEIFKEPFEFDPDLTFLDDFISASDVTLVAEPLKTIGESPQLGLKFEAYREMEPSMVKTTDALIASVLPKTATPSLPSFFTHTSEKGDTPQKWGQSGYLGGGETKQGENSISKALFGNPTTQTLNEALFNLSEVGKKNDDNDLCDIMNDMIMTSQTTNCSDATFDEK